MYTRLDNRVKTEIWLSTLINGTKKIKRGGWWWNIYTTGQIGEMGRMDKSSCPNVYTSDQQWGRAGSERYAWMCTQWTRKWRGDVLVWMYRQMTKEVERWGWGLVAYTHIKVKRGQKAWATGQSCEKVGMFGCIHTRLVDEINIGWKGTRTYLTNPSSGTSTSSPPCLHWTFDFFTTYSRHWWNSLCISDWPRPRHVIPAAD